jgi:hypothetical protein
VVTPGLGDVLAVGAWVGVGSSEGTAVEVGKIDPVGSPIEIDGVTAGDRLALPLGDGSAAQAASSSEAQTSRTMSRLGTVGIGLAVFQFGL